MPTEAGVKFIPTSGSDAWYLDDLDFMASRIFQISQKKEWKYESDYIEVSQFSYLKGI